MTPTLELHGVTKRFGGVTSLRSVDISFRTGSVCSIIGPNGAGKTTLFNVISGVLKPTQGSVHFNGADITRLRPDEIARLGLARTFQNLALFGAMTVLDTVLVGYHRHIRAGVAAAAFRLPRHRSAERRATAAADRILDHLGLHDLRHHPVVDLPYGIQRRVELARALVGAPSMVLLDEPMAGLTDAESESIASVISGLGSAGISVLLVEHHLRTVMAISERIIVLDWGNVIADGTPQEIRSDPTVIASYLGSRRR